MATIKDIAHEAGVSYTTVSNVIHGRSTRVSPQTISTINEIIKRLDYAPNMSARALVSNSSKVVGMINHLVPRSTGSFVEDPFHSAFIGAIEEVLRDNGYYLMLRTVEESADLLAFLRNWNVDGMFFTGMFEDDFYNTLKSVNIPIVLIDSYISHTNMQNIGLEDFKGGYIATKHLLDRGHRNIIFASPTIRQGGVVYERFAGYKQALSEAGVAFKPEYVFEQEIHVDAGISLGKRLGKISGITAIFATADILAAGIMAGLKEDGVRVPDEISVIGFDDISLCRLTTPTLTTIHQDAAQKGRIAVEFMMKRLEGLDILEREVILPVGLIERQSVRNLL